MAILRKLAYVCKVCIYVRNIDLDQFPTAPEQYARAVFLEHFWHSRLHRVSCGQETLQFLHDVNAWQIRSDEERKYVLSLRVAEFDAVAVRSASELRFSNLHLRLDNVVQHEFRFIHTDVTSADRDMTRRSEICGLMEQAGLTWCLIPSQAGEISVLDSSASIQRYSPMPDWWAQQWLYAAVDTPFYYHYMSERTLNPI